jgi:hypothetical protein
LIADLVGVESLRPAKQSVMFLTKDAVHVVTHRLAETIGAPSVAALPQKAPRGN